MTKTNQRKGFTFIEVLVVIAVIAVISVSVIYFLNPSQLQSQGRDTNRLSDMTTLNQNLALYHEVKPGGSLGSSSVLYVSIPDPAATSTAGTNCAGLGLPAGVTYHCASPANYRKIDGTGWVPVNFSLASNINIPTLPIDPINSTSSNEYYIYMTNGTQYELLSNPEAQKTINSSVSSSYIQGNNLALQGAFPGSQVVYTTSTYPANSYAGSHGSMAFDGNSNSIWEANYPSNTVTRINDATYATSTYVVQPNPLFITYDPHTQTVWTCDGTHTVVQLNYNYMSSSTYNIPCGSTINAAFDSHTNTLWFADGSSTVTILNDSTYATTTINIPMPFGLAFDSHTNTMWVAGNAGPAGTATQINDTTYATSTYAVGSTPQNIVFDPHTNTIWVGNSDTGVGPSGVTQINDTTYATSTYTLSASGSLLEDMAFDPHTNSIWIVDHGNNQLFQLNDTTYAVASYSVPYIGGVVFDSHTNAIWVSGNGIVMEFTPSK